MDGYSRDFVPLDGSADSEKRGIINDAAARLVGLTINRVKAELRAADGVFGRARVNSSYSREPSEDDLHAAIEAATAYVRGRDANVESQALTPTEVQEVLALGARIRRWLSDEVSSIEEVTVSPMFQGHGLIAHCEGDFLLPSGLVEVKAGDRTFRSVDYRQVAVYVALQFASSGDVFSNIMLANPRVGISIKVSTEEFAREVSGQSAPDLCNALLNSFGIALVSL